MIRNNAARWLNVLLGSLVWAFSLSVWAGSPPPSEAQGFSTFFHDQTLRIDYHHIGDAKVEFVTLDRVYRHGIWAGSMVNLIDPAKYGSYLIKVYDAASGTLIYSRGFDSYFKEYQTTTQAIEGMKKAFHESAIVPSPKKPIHFALDKRQLDGTFKQVFRGTIDPDDVAVIDGEAADPEVLVVNSQSNGDPHHKADIAIVAEGYTAAEEAKFRADLTRFTEVFFSSEPLKSLRHHFNVTGVFKPSAQSGVDEPRKGLFKRTAVGATFNALGSERYVLTEDNKALRDIAGHTPYDALYIMVNHARYGGGGIYNFYCTFTSDNPWSAYLMVHEFGHSFFGLADEYYTSSTAYNDLHPLGFEPPEPNITALLDPKNVKWKHLIEPGTPLPTPWNKATYDQEDLAWQLQRRQMNDHIAQLTRDKANPDEIKTAVAEYERLDKEHAEKMHKALSADPFAGKVGAFEGAGYATKGLYRPMADCIMFSKGCKDFCVVCKEALIHMVETYTQ